MPVAQNSGHASSGFRAVCLSSSCTRVWTSLLTVMSELANGRRRGCKCSAYQIGPLGIEPVRVGERCVVSLRCFTQERCERLVAFSGGHETSVSRDVAVANVGAKGSERATSGEYTLSPRFAAATRAG